MGQNNLRDGPKLESIFHPSNFSDASEVAFARSEDRTRGQDETYSTACRSESQYRMAGFPRRRRHAQAMGAHPENSPMSAVGQLSIAVDKGVAFPS